MDVGSCLSSRVNGSMSEDWMHIALASAGLIPQFNQAFWKRVCFSKSMIQSDGWDVASAWRITGNPALVTRLDSPLQRVLEQFEIALRLVFHLSRIVHANEFFLILTKPLESYIESVPFSTVTSQGDLFIDRHNRSVHSGVLKCGFRAVPHVRCSALSGHSFK